LWLGLGRLWMTEQTNRSIFDNPLNILVLMGGPSTERAVSLVSGKGVADALESCGHKVRRADISPADTSALDGEAPDVVFIAMHGQFGEDGGVQRLCEDRGLAYVGSPPEASELAMDKVAAKESYRRAGLGTPDWELVKAADDPVARQQLLASVGLPCACKPVNGGSSVDITLAKDAAQRDAAVEALLGKYGEALIERFVRGREFTVGVLGEQALPIIEIRPRRAFYDYTAKYDDDATEYVFEHGLNAVQTAAVQAAALAAHLALGCRDMSRSDFLMDGAGAVWILETNTIPGFTSHSLLPKAAGKIGIGFARLCEELVQMAITRNHKEHKAHKEHKEKRAKESPEKQMNAGTIESVLPIGPRAGG
jgi:D-alanine-D-alanine ligase